MSKRHTFSKTPISEPDIGEAGFEEIPHTADWSLRAWARSKPELFVCAARGMYALSGINLAAGKTISHHFDKEAVDEESLLVAFLSELIYLVEQENLAFDEFDLTVEEKKISEEPVWWLHAGLQGSTIASISKAIKAVTFHNLKIKETERGLETEIVFDV